jgi:NADH-quinone oxidoreductase subunit J
MVLDTIAFALLATVLVGSSLGAVTVRDVWHAALLLGVSLVTVAALYVTLAAEFLAAIQVLVYVGGVLILITFAVMLTRRTSDEEEVSA